jgi:hypothetical protein
MDDRRRCDQLFASLSKQIGALAARHAMTAISPYREFTLAGGLMSYGTAGAPAITGPARCRSTRFATV